MPKIDTMLACMVADHTGVVKQRIDALVAKKAETRIDQYRKLAAVVEHIDANVDQEINLADLARIAKTADAHIRRNFKDVFGMTPNQYLQERRIAKSQHLLVHTKLPIGEICLRVGYESIGSFTNLFKIFNRLTPSEYRQQKKSALDK